MAKSRITGRAGEHARHLTWARRWTAAKFEAAAILLSGGGVLLVGDGLVAANPPLGVAGLIAGGGAWWCQTQALAQLRRARQAAVGARSEQSVAAVLRSLGAHTVIHGAMIGGGGDVDHVCVGGPGGGPAHLSDPGRTQGGQFVAIETKTGFGRVRLEDGALVAGQRRIPGDPVDQLQRQAAALTSITGVAPDVVVCIPEMSNHPFRVGDVVVCSASDLATVISLLPRRLDDDRLASAARAVRKGSR